jgi:hypothetical protein
VVVVGNVHSINLTLLLRQRTCSGEDLCGWKNNRFIVE